MPAAAPSVPLRALPLVAFKCPTAQICVPWPFQPYLSVHKYVYFGHFNCTFQCTNMCTLAISTVPFSAQICVLRPLKVKRLNCVPHFYFSNDPSTTYTMHLRDDMQDLRPHENCHVVYQKVLKT
jgi:hypothetical protein